MSKYVLLVLLNGLLLFSCSAKKQTVQYADDVITSEIMVSLQAGAKIDALIENIKKPLFSLKQTISARMLIYLLEYDDHKYEPANALKTLQEHSNVKSAEFNKKVGIRDQN